MVVSSELRTHKVMEAAIRELMGAGTPPRFKFKDTYASIEFPVGYTVPAQATLEAKYNELLALEEDIQKTVVEGDLEVGTSNLFVDTETGRVGIGTTNPSGFDIYNKEINQTFRVDGTNIHRNNKYYIDSRDTSAPNTITTRYAVSAADDNGASAERSELVLGATADENSPIPGSSFISFSDSKKLYLGSHPDEDFMSDWSTVSNQAYPRMGSNTFAPHVTLLPSGNVGIGTVSPSYKLDVDGTIYASGDVIMFSDERKKTHIETIPNALEKVLQLRGVTFNKLDDDNRRHSGVIAQEVEKVLPEVVYTAEDDTKSVAYGNMIGLLIEAIKELAESRT
jgi:hypothetical protein